MIIKTNIIIAYALNFVNNIILEYYNETHFKSGNYLNTKMKRPAIFSGAL